MGIAHDIAKQIEESKKSDYSKAVQEVLSQICDDFITSKTTQISADLSRISPKLRTLVVSELQKEGFLVHAFYRNPNSPVVIIKLPDLNAPGAE
jgi:transcriptional regulator of NAD metabolism